MRIIIEASPKEGAVTVASYISDALANHGFPVNKKFPRPAQEAENLTRAFKKQGKRARNAVDIEVVMLKKPDTSDYDYSQYLTNDPDDGMIVKGTFIKVSDVVDLIIDGSTWADILRFHPEMTEEDIRACVSYTVNQEYDDGDSEETVGERFRPSNQGVGTNDKGVGDFTLHYQDNILGKTCVSAKCGFPACEEVCQGTGCHAGETDNTPYRY